MAGADEDVELPTVEVVLWRADGTTHRPSGLAAVPVDVNDAGLFSGLRATALEATGLDTAVLHLDDGVVHLEALDAGDLAWSTADVAIRGGNAWNRLGWWPSMLASVEAHVGPVREATVHKHWSISALVRVTTDAGAVWWKQSPGFMAQEGPVVEWLGTVAPGRVPALRAVADDWWIADEFTPLDDPPPTPLAALADLQERTVGRSDELVALGCPDRRTPRLLADLEALTAREDLLEDDLRSQLRDALPALADAAAALEALGVPDGLVHGDLHMGNVALTADGWVLYDWSDACLAPITFDLGLFSGTNADAVREERFASYLSGFAGPALRDRVAAALSGPMLGLAGAHHAVSYQRIVDGLTGDDKVGWGGAVAGFTTAALRHLR